tara:strand:+ start:110 stop:349 length:240 start_codon:yes stop_codon:yes gene_type:complete
MEVDVRIFIIPKEEILDPAAKTLHENLDKLGYEISEVSIGKCVDIRIKKGDDITSTVEKICKNILVNELTEDFSYMILH